MDFLSVFPLSFCSLVRPFPLPYMRFFAKEKNFQNKTERLSVDTYIHRNRARAMTVMSLVSPSVCPIVWSSLSAVCLCIRVTATPSLLYQYTHITSMGYYLTLLETAIKNLFVKQLGCLKSLKNTNLLLSKIFRRL